MDGAVDLKILLSLGGILFSVAGAAAIAKMQIKILADDCRELSRLLSALDTRCDKLHTLTETQQQRIDVLANLNSVDKLEFRNRETSKLLSDTAQALERVKHLEVMHNTVHPPVASERKAR
jgi:Tfp pilus assembly protein PilN|tara:strand:- start:1183 stop:1545 length:363 start_codon:yes stop_codon:yes gene_type:complete